MDPYEVLDVDHDASADQLKRARQKLAKKHHPDRGGDVQAMADLNRAYDILTDPEARKRYDETGSIGTVRSIDEEAVSILRQVVQQFIENERDMGNKNLVAFIQNAVSEARTQMDQQLNSNNRALKILSQKLEKLGGKEGATVLQDMFALAIRQKGEMLANLERGKLTMERCQEILKDYTDGTIENAPQGLRFGESFTKFTY